jgi:hypothetical protein
MAHGVLCDGDSVNVWRQVAQREPGLSNTAVIEIVMKRNLESIRQSTISLNDLVAPGLPPGVVPLANALVVACYRSDRRHLVAPFVESVLN